jgi:hypothetical protein
MDAPKSAATKIIKPTTIKQNEAERKKQKSPLKNNGPQKKQRNK